MVGLPCFCVLRGLSSLRLGASTLGRGWAHQQRGFPLRKYFIPGCVGKGLDLDLRIRPAAPAAASGNPSGWAQAGPKWVGPSWAQARNLGPKQFRNIKILKIKIRVAQNVGKVWISQKKNLSAPFGVIPGHFLRSACDAWLCRLGVQLLRPPRKNRTLA